MSLEVRMYIDFSLRHAKKLITPQKTRQDGARPALSFLLLCCSMYGLFVVVLCIVCV